MSYGVHSVLPPGFREGTNFGKILTREEVHFFKGRRGNTSGGGTRISDISLDHPGGGNANSVPQIFFCFNFILISCVNAHISD